MSLQKHQNLRANLDRLWFAGEANSAEYFGFLQGAWFEGQEVGARVAGMLGGKTVKIGINSNYTVSGPMAKYEILHGTTFYDEYNEGNGWDSSTILA